MGKLYKPDEFDSITELNIPFLFEDLNSVPNELDIQAILKALSEKKDQISFQFKGCQLILTPPHNPQQNLRVVVRMRRFKHKTKNLIVVKPEIVGFVKDSFTFEALQDFEFKPKIPENYIVQNAKRLLVDKEDEQPTNLEINPRDLSFSIVPRQVSKIHNLLIQKPYALMMEEEKNVDNEKKKKSDVTRFKHMNFSDSMIPEPDVIDPVYLDKPQFKIIRDLFEQRPIWIKNALLHELLNKEKVELESFYSFRKCLSYIAYSFKDGPWKHAYVRFNYDPRVNPESLRYQVIDLGIRENDVKLEPSIKRKEFSTYDPTFAEIPTQQRQLYQLCDINNKEVKNILEIVSKKDQDRCDKKFGWLSSFSYKQIVKILKNKIQST